MELGKIEAIIEAILFASGDEVECQTLSNILEIDRREIDKIISDMAIRYNTENRGLEIITIENSYQLRTRRDYFDYIKKLREHKSKNGLSQAALETLSIIAYKQPITKAEVELIRGVSSYSSLLRLMEYDLIKETGRMDAPGKPIIYETTEEFLKSFGFKSLKDLPSLEEFLENATEEVNNEMKTEETT